MISSPLSCHSLQGHQGAQRHMGKGGQVGRRAEKKSDEEKKNHRVAELIRCCDGFVSLFLIHSPHPSLFCLSFNGEPSSAAKKKHQLFTFNLSSVEFCSCVSKCPSHYIFLYNLFCLCGCPCGNMAFLLPLA